MDLPAHALWAFALFKLFPWQLQAVFFSILPDIIFGIPAVYFMLTSKGKRDYGEVFPKVEPYYRLAHSVFTPIALFAAFSIALRELYWPVLAGYLLHILMDVPFHKGGWVKGIAPFWPLSDWRVQGVCWWKEEVEKRPWLIAANYLLAAGAYFII